MALLQLQDRLQEQEVELQQMKKLLPWNDAAFQNMLQQLQDTQKVRSPNSLI